MHMNEIHIHGLCQLHILRYMRVSPCMIAFVGCKCGQQNNPWCNMTWYSLNKWEISNTPSNTGLFALKTGNLAWPRHLTQAVDFRRLGLDRPAWAGAPRPGLHPNTPYMHITVTIKVLTQMKIHDTQYHTLKKFPSTHPLMLSARWYSLGSDSSLCFLVTQISVRWIALSL